MGPDPGLFQNQLCRFSRKSGVFRQSLRQRLPTKSLGEERASLHDAIEALGVEIEGDIRPGGRNVRGGDRAADLEPTLISHFDFVYHPVGLAGNGWPRQHHAIGGWLKGGLRSGAFAHMVPGRLAAVKRECHALEDAAIERLLYPLLKAEDRPAGTEMFAVVKPILVIDHLNPRFFEFRTKNR